MKLTCSGIAIYVLLTLSPAYGVDSNVCAFNRKIVTEGHIKSGQTRKEVKVLGPSGRPMSWVEDYGQHYLDTTYEAWSGSVNAVVKDPLGPVKAFVTGRPTEMARYFIHNGKCVADSSEEFNAVNCSGVAGNGYFFDPKSLNIDAIQNYWDEETEELIFQTAVSSIHEFARCQAGIFDTYYGTSFIDNKAKIDLKNDAYAALNQIVKEYKEFEAMQKNRPKNGVHALPSDYIKQEMGRLVSRVPMGNRDLMRDKLVNLLTYHVQHDSEKGFGLKVNRESFDIEFESAMKEMAKQTYATLNRIEGPKDKVTGIRSGGIVHTNSLGKDIYCIDADLKTDLWRSGQISTTVDQYKVKDELVEGYMCRAKNRYGIEGVIAADVVLIPTYFLGYGLARVAARGGLAAVRGFSAEQAIAGSRMMMLGLEGLNLGSSAVAVKNTCGLEEMFTNVSKYSCDPRTELNRVYQEAQMGQCLTVGIISAVTPFVGLAAYRGAGKVADEVAEVADESSTILVTSGSGRKAAPYFTKAKAKEVGTELSNAGVGPHTVLTAPVSKKLTPDQRLYLIELQTAGFNKSQAKMVLDVLSDAKGKPLNKDQFDRLKKLLDDTVSEKNVDDVLDDLIRRKVIAVAPSARPAKPTSAVAESNPVQLQGDLNVAKADLILARKTGDSKLAQTLEKRIEDLELKLKQTKPSDAPASGSQIKMADAEGSKRLFTEEQKMELLLDPEYNAIIKRYPDSVDRDDAIEILSILKNHGTKQRSKTEIIDEFNKYAKQCN